MSTRKQLPAMEFHYRGQIEVGTGAPGYAWRDGYSTNSMEGHPTYPWVSKVECFREAKAEGCRAVFMRNGEIEP